MPTFLTYNQVSERLHVSHGTVRYWVTAGKLPAFKPGRHPLVRESDLVAFVEAHGIGAARAVTKRRGRR